MIYFNLNILSLLLVERFLTLSGKGLFFTYLQGQLSFSQKVESLSFHINIYSGKFDCNSGGF